MSRRDTAVPPDASALALWRRWISESVPAASSGPSCRPKGGRRRSRRPARGRGAPCEANVRARAGHPHGSASRSPDQARALFDERSEEFARAPAARSAESRTQKNARTPVWVGGPGGARSSAPRRARVVRANTPLKRSEAVSDGWGDRGAARSSGPPERVSERGASLPRAPGSWTSASPPTETARRLCRAVVWREGLKAVPRDAPGGRCPLTRSRPASRPSRA